MATASLTATVRSESGKGVARKLRAAKRVPAVIYGHHRDAQPLALDSRELERLLEQISAETTVVELAIDGKTARTLIREIQRHPVKREILHVDFQELVAGEKVRVNVPIVLHGTPQGVRDGGVLDQVMRELEVEVDPADIPDRFELDVSSLGINDSLHVSDLTVPEGVELFAESDSTVCVVAPPRVEAEPVAPTEGEVEPTAEPELIRKPKEEGEEAAPE
jgi:large subunit ribosomal protein L25